MLESGIQLALDIVGLKMPMKKTVNNICIKIFKPVLNLLVQAVQEIQ